MFKSNKSVGRNIHPTGEKMSRILLILLLLTITHANNLDCSNSNNNTYELMSCQKIEIVKYEAVLEKYWNKSLERYKDNIKVLDLMKKSQEQWLKYRSAECSTVHQIWIDGSIRGLFHGKCLLDMTKNRTHMVWDRYLTYIDSTPAILAEPK